VPASPPPHAAADGLGQRQQLLPGQRSHQGIAGAGFDPAEHARLALALAAEGGVGGQLGLAQVDGDAQALCVLVHQLRAPAGAVGPQAPVEQAAQRGARTARARHRRAHRDAHHLGQLGAAELLHADQQQRLALLGREPRQRRQQVEPQADVGARVGARAALGQLQRGGVEAQLPGRPALHVLVRVARDGPQPQQHVAALVERVPVGQRAFARALHQVVGLSLLERQRTRMAAQPGHGAPQLLPERGGDRAHLQGLRQRAADRSRGVRRHAADTSASEDRIPMDKGTTIDLVYIDAGGGHLATAQALEAVIREQRRPWRVNCVNLTALLDPGARFQRLTGVPPERFYNHSLARGWTFGMGMQLRLLQSALALGDEWMVRRLAAHWQRTRPDMVVSLVPNFNRAIGAAVARALPGTEFLTVMTDLADLPPRFWAVPGVEQHLVCGSARAAEQAEALGLEPQRIHRASGMVIRTDFYPPLAIDRELERVRLGLQPGRPTAVVMFGGQGSQEMLQIERELPDLQLVLMCGHNRALADCLRDARARAPRAVIGFTRDVCHHLQLGDLFIGKPGPGCLSEAVQVGLPVLTLRNARTLPQERYNTEWVLDHGLGQVLRSWRALRPAVADVLRRLDDYRVALARMDNRAVFEVPGLMERLLQPRVARLHAGTETPVRPLREVLHEA